MISLAAVAEQTKRERVRNTGKHWAAEKIEDIIKNADLRQRRRIRALTRSHKKRLDEVRGFYRDLSLEAQRSFNKVDSWFRKYGFLPRSYLKWLRLMKQSIEEELYYD